MKTLKNNTGGALVEVMVAFIGIMLCVALTLAVLPIFSTTAKLNNTADKIMRSAQTAGTTNILIDKGGLDFDLSWNGTKYIAGSKNIQLNETIALELTLIYDISFFEFGSFPVPVHVRRTGASEKYFK